MKSERTLRSSVELGAALGALSQQIGTLDTRLSAKVIRNFTAKRYIDTFNWKSITGQSAKAILSGAAGRVLRNCTLEITGAPGSKDWRFKIYVPGWVYLILIPFVFFPPAWLPMLIILPLLVWSFKASAPRLMEQIKTEIESLL